MRRKILITGGAGFIGSYLAEKYLAADCEVYIIDDLSTGDIENIRPLQENPEYASRIHVVIDTIMNYDKMLELIGICDTVFHMAAAVGVKYIIENPLQSITTNLRGTEIVLELCNKFRKKVLIASTSEAYGKQNHAPLSEDNDTVFGPSHKARWSYAAAKLMDEFNAIAYFRKYGLPVVVVRLFNTVGPRQTGRYGMVIPNFVRQAMANEEVTVFGDGTQTRTFTHVEEVCDALIKLIDTSGAYGEVVNVGGVEEVSMQELAEAIINKTSSSSTVKLIPYDQVYTSDFEDMPRRVPCTAKLKSLIGFAPQQNLDSILDDIISNFKAD